MENSLLEIMCCKALNKLPSVSVTLVACVWNRGGGGAGVKEEKCVGENYFDGVKF